MNLNAKGQSHTYRANLYDFFIKLGTKGRFTMTLFIKVVCDTEATLCAVSRKRNVQLSLRTDSGLEKHPLPP